MYHVLIYVSLYCRGCIKNYIYFRGSIFTIQRFLLRRPLYIIILRPFSSQRLLLKILKEIDYGGYKKLITQSKFAVYNQHAMMEQIYPASAIVRDKPH